MSSHIPPSATEVRITGGTLLVEQLLLHGVDTVFGVPGESYLGVLDALYEVRDRIRYVMARVENGAANMADAYGKLTGRPGVCMVSRGPGATHASIGIHTAMQDSTPLVMLIGQVGRGMRDREAFQEVDYRAMFGPLAKWVAEIDQPERIPEYLARAFHVAMSGRPGPVVLSLPEDVTSRPLSMPVFGNPGRPLLPYITTVAGPQPARIRQAMQMLAQAERPFLMLGGPGWTNEGIAAIARFAGTNNLPTGCSFRAQDRLDNRHDCYVGDFGTGINPALAAQVAKADLLLVVGSRLGEMTTGNYTRITPPRSDQVLIHIHPSDMELASVYQPDLAIQSGLALAAEALAAEPAVEPRTWDNWTAECRRIYLDNIAPQPASGPLNMSEVFGWLNRTLPDDAILCNGAGNSTAWLHRFYQYRRFRTQVAPTSGAMGYGVAAAVGAAIIEPERLVVGVVGDGCFQMSMQELGTALQYQAKPILIVVNNGTHGTIRVHQERNYPERVIATDLVNPDFQMIGQAYDCHIERVERTEDFPVAFERAQKSGKAALIEMILDQEALTTRMTLSEIRAAGLARSRG